MNDTYEIKNAIIERVQITTDDHNLLTAYLTFDYGGAGQAFGGYTLYLPKSFAHHDSAMNRNFAGHFIFRCMEIAGVTDWSKIAGKTVRVKCNGHEIHSIGHIIKDDWFCPSLDFKP